MVIDGEGEAIAIHTTSISLLRQGLSLSRTYNVSRETIYRKG